MDKVYILDIVIVKSGETEALINSSFITPNEKRKNDRNSLLSLAVAKKIFMDNKDSIDSKDDVAVIAATCFGATRTLEDEILKYANNGMVSPIFITKILPSMQAAIISIALDFKGSNYSIATGQNASCDAIIDGYTNLKVGQDKFALIACSDSFDNEYGRTVYKNYCPNNYEPLEGGAAILLGNQKKDKAIAVITHVYKAILSQKDRKYPFSEDININNNHGIFIPSTGNLIVGQKYIGGSRTAFDLQYGIKYCQENGENEFTVFSIEQEIFYSALTVKIQ